jgi:peroxiredoxin
MSKAGSAIGEVSVGKIASDFTLKDLNDNSVTLSSLFGKKPVLLNFTTTWCPHCVKIIPELNDINNRYKNLEVMAVYIREDKKELEEFAKEHNISYRILLDSDGFVASDYAVTGVPTIVIIDKNGIIKYKGHALSKDIIEEMTK